MNVMKMNFFLLSLMINIALSQGDDDEKSLFPYLNMTSITMIDSKGNLVEGYLTQPPTGRSSAQMEKSMSSIQYTLYTRKNPQGVVIEDAEGLRNTSFKPIKKTKLITHGWLSSGHADTCIEIKNGYLESYDVNVIVMNWEEIAKDYFYINPVRSVPKIAHHYAILINDMINSLKVNPKNIHLIGHSLGAQISGLVWKDMEGKKPGRVTGLDPAFPGFDNTFMFSERISDESASFVDVIHSCGGLLGILDPVGHVDFYPNGGTANQPGCDPTQAVEACSHGRSWKFFAESVKYPKRRFLAVKCDEWTDFLINQCSHNSIVMGERVPFTARGKYYLRTNPKAPFSIMN